MKVTTTTVGGETQVTVEGTNGVYGSNLITNEVTLNGSEFQSDYFIGLTLAQIKTRFRLTRGDGSDLIVNDRTTLVSSATGTIDLGYTYSNTKAYFIVLSNG